MRLIDPQNPFYRPAWRRYLIVAAPLLWAGVEWGLGNNNWAIFFVAISFYLAYHLLLKWPPDTKD